MAKVIVVQNKKKTLSIDQNVSAQKSYIFETPSGYEPMTFPVIPPRTKEKQAKLRKRDSYFS